MKLQITLTVLFVTLTMLLSVSAVTLIPNLVSAHDGQDHGLETAMDNAAEIAQMKALIALLQELLVALQAKAEMGSAMSETHSHSHMHDDSESESELAITVELHGGNTHVHVYNTDGTTDTFFVEVAISDEGGVFAAIAAETGLDLSDITAATTFEVEEEHDHDHGSDSEGSHADMDGLDGIHIMADGTVMLGNGDEVDDATIDDEGMIMLGDGTVVEPVMDMR